MTAPMFAVLSATAFPLWQTTAAPRLPPVPLVPSAISRLMLPIYGSEHLLQFVRSESKDHDVELVLPLVVRFREGEQLERLADGDVTSVASTAVGVECAARGRLFQAIAQRSLMPWDLLKLGEDCDDFNQALLRCLAQNGWQPSVLQLGAAGGGGKARYREEEIGYRDMGANTPAAPSSVRVGELSTALICTRVDGGQEVLQLELEGPGEAVLLARKGGVRVEATAATWEQRAVTPERLPELGRVRNLRALFP